MWDGPWAWACWRFTTPSAGRDGRRANGSSPRWRVSGDCVLRLILLFARVLGKPEEGRYVQLRQEWKSNLPLRFLFFFEFQALLDVVLSLPFLIVCLNAQSPLGWAEFSVRRNLADRNGRRSDGRPAVERFKNNPANKGKTCQAGIVEIFAASELFLRMADLGGIRSICD